MMAELGLIASMFGIATAGVKLAIGLRDVGCAINSAPQEVHDIATSVSLFSMTLKQIGGCIKDGESPHSAGAIETIKEIVSQSRSIFNQLDSMISRTRKEINGRDQSLLSLKRRIQWVFNKTDVQYLIGQLESSKLTLSLMLQVFQLRKTMEGSK